MHDQRSLRESLTDIRAACTRPGYNSSVPHVTLNPTLQEAEQTAVLARMLDRVGDGWLATTVFPVKDPDFAGTYETTWALLVERGWIETRHAIGTQQYVLTPTGWLTALERTGQIDAPEVLDRCQRLTQAFKRAVDGRRTSQGALVNPHTLASETALPLAWICTAVEAGLLQRKFPTHRMNAYWDVRANCFRVPVTFGISYG